MWVVFTTRFFKGISAAGVLQGLGLLRQTGSFTPLDTESQILWGRLIMFNIHVLPHLPVRREHLITGMILAMKCRPFLAVFSVSLQGVLQVINPPAAPAIVWLPSLKRHSEMTNMVLSSV